MSEAFLVIRNEIPNSSQSFGGEVSAKPLCRNLLEATCHFAVHFPVIQTNDSSNSSVCFFFFPLHLSRSSFLLQLLLLHTALCRGKSLTEALLICLMTFFIIIILLVIKKEKSEQLVVEFKDLYLWAGGWLKSCSPAYWTYARNFRLWQMQNYSHRLYVKVAVYKIFLCRVFT